MDSTLNISGGTETPLSHPSRKRVLWKWTLGATLALFAFAFYECSIAMRTTWSQSDAATAHFHALLDAGEYGRIYAEADPAFRDSGKQDEVVAFLLVVHRKLGNVVKADRGSVFVNASTNGKFATVTYNTTFAQGTGNESFVWHISGSELRLYGYHINSNELIMK